MAKVSRRIKHAPNSSQTKCIAPILKIPPDVIENVIDYLYSAKANIDSDISQRSRLIYTAKRYLTSGDEETQRFFTRIGFSKRDVLRLATFWAKDGDQEMNFLVGYFYNFGYAGIKNENIEALKWFVSLPKVVTQKPKIFLGRYTKKDAGVFMRMEQKLKNGMNCQQNKAMTTH
nr:hypothetical protein PJ912_05155 [Pectobacterium colocasium]